MLSSKPPSKDPGSAPQVQNHLIRPGDVANAGIQPQRGLECDRDLQVEECIPFIQSFQRAVHVCGFVLSAESFHSVEAVVSHKVFKPPEAVRFRQFKNAATVRVVGPQPSANRVGCFFHGVAFEGLVREKIFTQYFYPVDFTTSNETRRQKGDFG
jgi:hypothetical protein